MSQSGHHSQPPAKLELGKRSGTFSKVFRWQTEKPGPQPVAVALAGWFWTQALIGRRAFPEGRIGDGVLALRG